jgi:Rrf2 family protein
VIKKLRLTTLSRYGTRAIFDIAYHSAGLPVQVKDISKRQKIPYRYLGQIFHGLKKANIVESVRGPRGGYVLAKDPKKITVGDIIKAMREHTYPVYCVDGETERSKECDRSEQCVTRLIWREAGEVITKFFYSVTISDLCEKAIKIGVRRDMKHQFDYNI